MICYSIASSYRLFYLPLFLCIFFFFFSSRRRHTRYWRDWSSDVCSSDLALQVTLLREDARARPARGRVDGPMLERRLGHRRQLAEVVRDDHARDRALVERDAVAAVDQVPDLRRVARQLAVLVRDVLEERLQVDLLLVAPAERRPRLLADEREHGLVVELRVVQAVQEVDRAGARRREADADLAGPLGVRAGHERGHLLMAHLDELDLVGELLEGADDRVDPVARIAVDATHTVVVQSFEQELGGRLAHGDTPFRS